jgi:hypothetical protein
VPVKLISNFLLHSRPLLPGVLLEYSGAFKAVGSILQMGMRGGLFVAKKDRVVPVEGRRCRATQMKKAEGRKSEICFQGALLESVEVLHGSMLSV